MEKLAGLYELALYQPCSLSSVELSPDLLLLTNALIMLKENVYRYEETCLFKCLRVLDTPEILQVAAYLIMVYDKQ